VEKDAPKLLIKNIPHLNTLVLQQVGGKGFFIATNNSIVIGIDSLAFILHFLVMDGAISHKVLEGILEEYHSDRKGE